MADCSQFATVIGEAAEALIQDEAFAARFNENGADNYDLVVSEIQRRAGGAELIPRADISQAWTEYRRSLNEKKKKTLPGQAAEIRRQAYTEEDKRNKGIEILRQIATGNFRPLKGLGRKLKVSEAMEAINAQIADLMDARAIPMKLSKRIAELGGEYQGTDIAEARQIIKELNRQAFLTKHVAEIEAKLAKGDLSAKGPGATVNTENVAALKAELAALNKNLSDSRVAERLTAALADIADRVANNQPAEGKKPDRPAAREDIAAMREELTQWKKRESVLLRLKKMRAAIRSGDYSEFEKKTYFEPGGKPPEPPELAALRYEADKMRRDIEEEIEAQRPLSPVGRVLHTFDFLRSNILSIDRGGFLRQGGKAALMNTTEFAKAVKAARYGGRMTDESASRIYAETIAMAPLQERLDTGLDEIIPETGSNYRLTDGERIGGGLIAKAMRGSNSKVLRFWAEAIADSDRSMNVFLGRLRMEMYLAAVSANDGNLTIEDKRNLVQDIAIATGRGTFNSEKGNRAMGIASEFLLSPRWMLSQFQFIGKVFTSGLSNNRATKTSRRYALRKYGRYAAVYAALMGIASLFADEVEKDPRSSNFGKARFGKRWVGMTAGLGKAITLLSRIVTGQSKTGKGKIVGLRPRDQQPLAALGLTKSYKKDYTQSIKKAYGFYLSTSLAPLPKFVLEATSGEDVVGRRVTALSLFEGMLTPLQLGQIVDTMVAEGMTPALAWEFLGIVGADMRRDDDNWKEPDKGPVQKVFERVREKMRDVPEEEPQTFGMGSAGR